MYSQTCILLKTGTAFNNMFANIMYMHIHHFYSMLTPKQFNNVLWLLWVGNVKTKKNILDKRHG